MQARLKCPPRTYVERKLGSPCFIGDGGVISSEDYYYLHQMLGNQGFLPIACAVDDSNELDITSLKMSDRTSWMAHIFTYGLHDGLLGPKIDILFEFIRFCLFEPSSPAACYWAANGPTRRSSAFAQA